MRLIVALLTCVTLGGISLALANDPDPTPQPPAATQSEKSSTPRADQTTTTANATPPSASTAVAPADKAVTASSAVPGTAPAQSPELPELAAEEKNLIAHGYRLEVRNGENYFCHAEAMVGTRFKSKACGTAQQLAATRRNSKDVLERAQRPGSDHPAK